MGFYKNEKNSVVSIIVTQHIAVGMSRQFRRYFDYTAQERNIQHIGPYHLRHSPERTYPE